MIYRGKFLVSFPLVLMLVFCQYPPSYALDSGYSQYGNFVVDYSGMNGERLRKEGDEYFVKAYDSPTESEQEQYYIQALHKYYILSQVYPADYYAYVQLARINDEEIMTNWQKDTIITHLTLINTIRTRIFILRNSM